MSKRRLETAHICRCCQKRVRSAIVTALVVNARRRRSSSGVAQSPARLVSCSPCSLAQPPAHPGGRGRCTFDPAASLSGLSAARAAFGADAGGQSHRCRGRRWAWLLLQAPLLQLCGGGRDWRFAQVGSVEIKPPGRAASASASSNIWSCCREWWSSGEGKPPSV